MTDRGKRIFGLDLLRCLAILLVLIAHTFAIGAKNKMLLAITYYCGLTGVELFFVLSGFLIGTILIRMHNQSEITHFKSIGTFWIRRWFRTLPNYYLVIIIYNLIYYRSYHGLVFSFHSNTSYLLFFQNFLTEMPGKLFTVSWSLGIEEWFYLLFPLILFGLQYIVRQKQAALVVLIVLFICIPLGLKTFLYFDHSGISFDNGYRKIIPLRLDSIGIGVLLAFIQYYYTDHLKKNRRLLLFIGLAGIILLTGTGFYSGDNGFFQKTIFFTALSFSVMTLLPWLTSINKAKVNGLVLSVVTFISIISYSIYLLHTVVILVLQLLFDKFHLTVNTGINIGLIWLLTIIASYLNYHFFESKMTNLRDKIRLPFQSAAARRGKTPLKIKN